MMRGKFRKEKRLSSFLFRFGSFFLIIICHDGVNSSIHFLRYSDGSTGTAKYKSFVAFDLLSTEACQLLDLIKCIIGFILVKKGIWLQNILA